jgi:hypothetical protein
MDYTQPSGQSLSTAKLFDESQRQEDGFAAPAFEVPRDNRSWEKSLRWVSPLVAVMLGAAVGLTVWKHKDSLAATSREARERARNPIDLLMWFAGSDKTVADVVKEAQRRSATQFEEMKPAYFGDDFKTFDPQALIGQPFQNSGQSRTH